MCNKILFAVVCLFLFGCSQTVQSDQATAQTKNQPYLVVLGTVQDAGSPHIGCIKDCCKPLFDRPDPTRKVVSLGLVLPKDSSAFLFEATPDISSQLAYLNRLRGKSNRTMPDGIFLTHAHIGHYTGLMYLGREAINADRVPVYAMPKMRSFIEGNGPWSQLVELGNIELNAIDNQKTISLEQEVQVTPIRVPHRDEFSETVGFLISGPSKKALFIPDIDKWEKWNLDIKKQIKQVDYAFIDATFYDAEEVGYRDMSEIPHPFIIETIALFKNLPAAEKGKIHFIHLNHTNPALNTSSNAYQDIIDNGFNVAAYQEQFGL
jgi:pyrroloquinoline quinone biosynthesis protein B